MNPNGKSDFPGANLHRSAQDLVSLHQLRMQHKVIYWLVLRSSGTPGFHDTGAGNVTPWCCTGPAARSDS